MDRNIVDFLEQYTLRVADLERDASIAHWNHSVAPSDATSAEFETRRKALHQVKASRGTYARVRTYDEDCVGDSDYVRRQVRRLRLELTQFQLPLTTLARLVEHRTEAKLTLSESRAVVDGESLTAADVTGTLLESDDSNRRQAVWEASKAVGTRVGPQLLRLVGLRNRAARDLEFRDYYHMSLARQEIDVSALFDMMERLVVETEAAFSVVKADLDGSLADRFGIAIRNLRPWHYADPFFQDAPPRRSIDVDSFYNGQDIVELTRRFFTGIGLDIDDIIARSDLAHRDDKAPEPFTLHVDRRDDDVRVLTHGADTRLAMRSMLYEFGHAAYRKYLGADLPYLLRAPSHRLLSEAVAMMIERLPQSPDFLLHVVGADKDAVARATRGFHASQRMEMLIKTRWVTVMVYFERALYEDPGRDLQKTWWELVERFQQIRMPEGRENASDWATKPHLVSAPVNYHNYILGKLVDSQLRSAMRNEAGEGVIDNEKVGRFLRNRLFRLGARYPWNDTLRIVTSEHLSPSYFLSEYVES